MPWGNWFSLGCNVRARCYFLHYFSYHYLTLMSVHIRSLCVLWRTFTAGFSLLFIVSLDVTQSVSLCCLSASVLYSAVSCKWITRLCGLRIPLWNLLILLLTLFVVKESRSCQTCLYIRPKILANNKLCHYCSFFWCFGTAQPSLSGLLVINVFCYCPSLLAICLTALCHCVSYYSWGIARLLAVVFWV